MLEPDVRLFTGSLRARVCVCVLVYVCVCMYVCVCVCGGLGPREPHFAGYYPEGGYR